MLVNNFDNENKINPINQSKNLSTSHFRAKIFEIFQTNQCNFTFVK